MSQEKYIGMLRASRSLKVCWTKAAMMVEFIQGQHGTLSLTFEEGTSAAWLHDLLSPTEPAGGCDPRDASDSPLDESRLSNDRDFEEEADEEEVDSVEPEIEKKCEPAATKARPVARWEAEKEIEARERARKRHGRAPPWSANEART